MTTRLGIAKIGLAKTRASNIFAIICICPANHSYPLLHFRFSGNRQLAGLKKIPKAKELLSTSLSSNLGLIRWA